jgi:uncharacterized SAM-binding protein YcdF (DUF218 family)
VKRWRLACRAVGIAGAALLAASAFTPLPNALHSAMSAEEQLAPADAIVVLGSSVREDGVLGDNSLRRAVHGMVLFKRGLAPLLLLLGPPATADGPSEAQVRLDLARTLGLPPAAILVDAGVRTTQDEAIASARQLIPKGASRVLLVTGRGHMWRAARLFERQGFTVLPAPVDEVAGTALNPEGRLILMRNTLKEVSARLLYRVLGRV